MKKVPKRHAVIGVLHKSFVFACIGVTLVGSSYLLMRGYHYYTKVKPEMKQKQLLETQDLLSEGSSEKL